MAITDLQNRPGATRLKHDGALSIDFSIADFPSSGSGSDTAPLVAIPARSLITYARLINHTAWNGTAPEIVIGSSSDDNSILTTTQFTPTTGVKECNSGIDTGDSPLLLIAKLTFTAKPTAGESVFVIHFTEYGRDAGSPSMAYVAQVASS